MPDHGETFKLAGAEAALVQLGLAPAEALEKEAFINAGIKLVRGAGGLAKGLWNMTGGKVTKGLTKRVGDAGTKMLDDVAGRSPFIAKHRGAIEGATKGLAGEMVLGAGLGGGLNAALAEPGDRWNAFARGAASGALSGALFNAGSNVARQGISRLAGKGATRMKALAGRVNDVGQTAVDAAKSAPWLKRKGAWLGMTAVPFAAGMGLSWHTPHFSGSQPSPVQQRFGPSATPMAHTGMRLARAIPRAYNPNLPLGQ